jgi:hypothetical protein
MTLEPFQNLTLLEVLQQPAAVLEDLLGKAAESFQILIQLEMLLHLPHMLVVFLGKAEPFQIVTQPEVRLQPEVVQVGIMSVVLLEITGLFQILIQPEVLVVEVPPERVAFQVIQGELLQIASGITKLVVWLQAVVRQ